MNYLIFLCFLVNLFCLSTLGQTFTIDQRFAPGDNVSSGDSAYSLWRNPAGLGFIRGNQNNSHYLYELNKFGDRHHFVSSSAFNFSEIFSLGLGFATQLGFSESAQNNFGNNYALGFASAFKTGEKTSMGVGVLKSHNSLTKSTSDFLFNFGFQSKLNSYFALGASYQEYYNGFFNAPILSAGLSFRPAKDITTITLESVFTPRSSAWRDGFRVDPVLKVRANFSGFSIFAGAQIPGVISGWKNPLLDTGFDINFYHFGLGLFSYLNPAQSNYGIGLSFRSSSARWPSVKRDQEIWATLTIDSFGNIETKPKSFAEQVFLNQKSPHQTLATLKRMQEDERLRGVILNLRGFALGAGRAQEWRDAIVALRAANKSVIVYLDMPNERDYFVASAANKIFINPNSTLTFYRFSATLKYYADTLDKFGIKAESIVAGKHKNAPRRFTANSPNTSEIKTINNILNSFYQEFISAIESSRLIGRNELIEIFDQGEILPEFAKARGLVDDVLFFDQIPDTISQEESSSIYIYSNFQDQRRKKTDWSPDKKIALIPITGSISRGRIYPSILPSLIRSTGSFDVIDAIESAIEDDSIQAIILRIDSPGGSSAAGHEIFRTLINARLKKPIIASMGDVAASAAYLIATGTNHIIAQKNTITGSIGVFSLSFSAQELANKIKVRPFEYSLIKNPGPHLLRRYTDSERKIQQNIVDDFYQKFIDSVAQGLGRPSQEIAEHAQGKIFLGKTAAEFKLVHEIGGIQAAIDKAKKLANITDKDENVYLQISRPGPADQFPILAPLSKVFGKDSKTILPSLEFLTKSNDDVGNLIEAYRLNGTTQARLPFHLDWKNNR